MRTHRIAGERVWGKSNIDRKRRACLTVAAPAGLRQYLRYLLAGTVPAQLSITLQPQNMVRTSAPFGAVAPANQLRNMCAAPLAPPMNL